MQTVMGSQSISFRESTVELKSSLSAGELSGGSSSASSCIGGGSSIQLGTGCIQLPCIDSDSVQGIVFCGNNAGSCGNNAGSCGCWRLSIFVAGLLWST